MTSPPDDPQATEASELERALSSLPGEQEPPPELERRILASLKTRGLVGHAPRLDRTPLGTRRVAAAALLLLALGIGGGVGFRILRTGTPAPQTTAGAEWMLLLYEDQDYRSPPPGGRAERVRRYVEWARQLEAQGALLSAGELSADGTLLASTGERVLEEARVPASDFGVVAGYFVLRAESRGEALALANGCPHLDFGGRVSLRRIGSS